MLRDLKSGLRSLARDPGFALVSILTLALAIGANTAVFTVVNAALLRPLPFSDPARLVQLLVLRPSLQDARDNFSEGEYHVFEQRNRTFSRLAAYHPEDSANLSGDPEPLRVSSSRITFNLLPLLGVEPLVGRGFLEEEDRPGSDDAVLISHRLWRTRYGSDAGLIGRAILVDGRARRVVGVLPAGFRFPSAETDLWLPLALHRVEVRYQSGQYLRVIGRLAAGAEIDQANRELQVLSDQLTQENLTRYPGMRAFATPLLQHVTEGSRDSLLVLMAAVGMVLLIACANLAGLLMARTVSRGPDYATRLAMGASKGRIVRLMAAEHFLLALLGGLLGLLVAWAGVPALVALGGESIPRSHEISLSGEVLAFTALISLAVPFVFGLAPAFQAFRIDLIQALKQGGRFRSENGGHRFRNALVAAQLALCFALFTGAGLLIQTLHRMSGTDPGFKAEKVLTLRTTLPQARYPAAAQLAGFVRQAVHELQSLAGIEQVAAVSALPLSGQDFTGFAWKEGIIPSPDIVPPDLQIQMATPGYFQVMGIPLLKGRDLEDGDDSNRPEVAVISHRLAQTLWPGQDPLGKRFKVSRQPTASTPWRTVVGVAGDVRARGLGQTPLRMAYFPHAQWPTASMSIVARTEADPLALIPVIRSKIQKIDPEQPIYSLMPMQQLVDESIAGQRFSTVLLGIFAAVAATLVTVGVYGVVSYSVNQRQHEFGIRMAIGASPAAILRLVAGRGMTLVLVGLAAGWILAWHLADLISGQLYQISASDPLTFTSVALLLAVVMLAACTLPARRASRLDPLSALRND